MIRQKPTPMRVYSGAHSSQTRHGLPFRGRKDRMETHDGAEGPRKYNIGMYLYTYVAYTHQNEAIVTGTVSVQFDLQYVWPMETIDKQI